MYTRSYKGNLPPEYQIRHQFTVQQVGKGGKFVIVIDQGIMDHTNFNPKNVQKTYSLRVYQRTAIEITKDACLPHS